MVEEPQTDRKRACAVCGAEIPEGVDRCSRCPGSEGVGPGGEERERWAENPMALAAKGAEIRGLVRSGQAGRAGAMVQAMPLAAQAALVSMDEDPEAMLSLTGMDAAGKPAYRPEVLDLLPSELLASLVAYRTEEEAFNTKLVQAMAPSTFRRTVEDTLDAVDQGALRTRVTWEWMKALAAERNANRRAELLRSVDPAVLEEALADRLAPLNLSDVVWSEEGVAVTGYQLFSEDGAVGMRPGDFIEDPETGDVLDALYEADADLLRVLVRGAWIRVEGGP